MGPPFLSCRSGQIDRKALEVGELAMLERALVSGSQHDPRRLPGIERFLPTRRTETPAVAGVEAGKAILRNRRRQIVAARLGEPQKLGRRDHADRVTPDLLPAGVAAAVPEKARHRLDRAALEPLAQDVPRGYAAVAAAIAVAVSGHI